MNVFVDTNIFLDVALKRDGFKESLIILNAAQKGLFNGFIADITLLNIAYIAQKQLKNINNFITQINQSFTVVGADNNTFTNALLLQNKDLEDAVQYMCAQECDCDIIVSNDKGFYVGKIPVLNAKTFIKQYA
ncbi:MAG: PIN domain-containing protein [Gammaproteobacteria bacterium]|nr:PIN domain-containing protein [Gammaproteobacteria bacterium]